MADTATIVPALQQGVHFAVSKSGELSEHVLVAYAITGETAKPIYFPPIPRGSDVIEERSGSGYIVGDLHARSPAEIAQKRRGLAS